FSQAPEHVVQFWWDRWRSFFRLQRGYELKSYGSWQQKASKRLRELFHEIQKKGAPHGWIPENMFGRVVEFWRHDDFKRQQWTNTKNRASETGGLMHTGGSTTYPATRERMVTYVRCLRGLTPARRIVSGWTSDHMTARRRSRQRREAIWLRIAAGRKKGRIYGKGFLPAYSVPLIIGDVDGTDTASGPPDVREQVTLLNRELSQQAEANL
ncbi:hypothetical protein PIB30_108239, partial [Stylosanthes scabra]|nr:hypothetical protein [Stylosanthes scabra]